MPEPWHATSNKMTGVIQIISSLFAHANLFQTVAQLSVQYFTLHTSPFYLSWKCVCFGWLLPSKLSWLQQTHPITQTNVSFTPTGQSRQMFICMQCLIPSEIQIQFSGCKQCVSAFASQYSSLLAVLFVPLCIQLSWPMCCLCLPTLTAASAYQLSCDLSCKSKACYI